VFTYLAALFLLPCVFLGALIPVAIKAALEKSRHTGGTVGRMYALGAIGSIFGTFLAGFFLIPAIGYTGVIWATSAAILVLGLIYSPKYHLLQIWGVMLVLLVFLATGRGRWVEQTATFLTLRDKPDPNVIYEDQTQYCYVRINQTSVNPDRRVFVQDKLSHSFVSMNDINELQYLYERIYAAMTEQASSNINNPSFLAIGGGGFVFPRYLKHRWPAGTVDVAEIDPGVTKAATAAFGLPENHGLNIFTMDARNFIDILIAKKHAGQEVPGYDIIYGDAFDNFSVPYHLVTREFNEKLSQLLKEDGFYMLNLIDVYESGLVLGSVLNTMKETFRNIYVFAPSPEYYHRVTFVLIASRQTIDIDSLVAKLSRHNREIWLLSPSEINTVITKCGTTTLTDDYAPMDNLAAAISIQEKNSTLANACRFKARELSHAGQWDKAIKMYMKAIGFEYPLTIIGYFEITEDLLAHREYQETVQVCEKALQYYDKPGFKSDVSSIDVSMGMATKALGQSQESRRHFNRAIEQCRQNLEKDPNTINSLSVIGTALVGTGRYEQATEYFRRAIKIAPTIPQYRFMLIEALIVQKNYAGAQAEITDAIDSMKQAGNTEAVTRLEQLSGRIKQTGR